MNPKLSYSVRIREQSEVRIVLQVKETQDFGEVSQEIFPFEVTFSAVRRHFRREDPEKFKKMLEIQLQDDANLAFTKKALAHARGEVDEL